MKKLKLTTILLAVIMAAQTFASAVLATEVAGAPAGDTFVPKTGTVVTVPSITGSLPKGNLLTFSRFNSANCMLYFTSQGPNVVYDSDDNGGFIRVGDISSNSSGVLYESGNTIQPGKYLFTGYFRTLRMNQLTELRIIAIQQDGTEYTVNAYPTNDWLKVEFYFELTDVLKHFKICGGNNSIMRQDFCMDQFSLVPVDEIPADAKTFFGTPVTPEEVAAYFDVDNTVENWDPAKESKYEVQGIIINQDTSGFLTASSKNAITETQIAEFARQFEGTHITDYFLSINDQCSIYPSETLTSYLDKYYQKEENGQAVDWSTDSMLIGTSYLFETLATDFIGTLLETFPTVGINPWLSFRMNDVHDQASMEVSPLFTDFYHNHPEVRRVKHHTWTATFDKAMDYTHDIVRELMLNYINETLNRYDTYGIELDFQREIYLWHIGGEYNGLEILNDFMRDVDKLVAIYEEKYGHEIKVAARVAYDVETNFELGLDVITWMSEGLIDMIIPASRFSTVDMDLPIKMWDVISESYDVELVASMEASRLMTHEKSVVKHMDIETMSAFAANAFSQGADKVYIFNYYRDGNNFFTINDKITTKSTYHTATSAKGMWNALTTLGSYDKLMTMNRRNIVTWKDTKAAWEKKVEYLPITVRANTYYAFRIPVGDVVEGSTLTVKFSVSNDLPKKYIPKVYANSVECSYNGLDLCKDSFTDYMLMCYDIPADVHNDGYMVIEVNPSSEMGTSGTFVIDYMEVFVEAP